MDEKFFDERAGRWRMHRHADPLLLAELIRVADVRRGMRVLDVGCGDGILSPMLSETVGAAGTVLGVDASAAMVEEARRRHAGTARVTFRRIDVERELPQGRFDRIILLDVWPHLATPVITVRRLVEKALAVDGRLLIAHDMGREAVNAVHARFAPAGTHALPPAGALAEALGQCGLRVVARKDTEACYYLLLDASGAGFAY